MKNAKIHQGGPRQGVGPVDSGPRRRGASRRPPAYGVAFADQLRTGGLALQTKLTVNEPGDRFEREADHVADQVMRMPDARVGGRVSAAGPGLQRAMTMLQRVCAECEEELHRKASDEEEEPRGLQLEASAGGGSTPTPAAGARIRALQGGGRPLSRSERTFFEPRFGADFGGVRVHTDSRADAAARSVSARAFTLGRDVVFRGGEYAPSSASGRRLMAHELTHVLQQGAAAPEAVQRDEDDDSYPAAEPRGSPSAIRLTPLSSPTIQRLGNLSRLPPGLACPVPTTGPMRRDHVFMFNHDSAVLSPAQIARLDGVAAAWHGAGASAPVRVDGYASTEGGDPHNWRLACARSLAVVAGLEHPTTGTGIRSTHIEFFTQGETAEFGPTHPPNRRATIGVKPVPAAPPAPAPTPTPPPPGCTTPTGPDRSGRGFNPTTLSQGQVVALHPVDAWTARGLANTALAAAGASGLAGLHLGPADAFRHCLWSCSMAQRLGTARAEQIATGHENSGPSGIPHDNQMDLHNNATGRSLATPGANCDSACRTAVASGQLRTVRGPRTRPPASPPVTAWCIGASSQPWP